MKAIIIACIVVIIAALIYLLVVPKPQPEVREESYILLDSINMLSDEQLASISAEQTAFNTAMENDIASSMSIFYYE